ncbi:MAG TPA: DciA family protein [Gallionella sp.]|nr:DciA family protein [Gallionella sp.]
MVAYNFVAHRFGTLLSGSPELRPLVTRAQALSDLQRHFAGVAPAYLAQSSMVSGLNFGTLTVFVPNATVAAKLRQLAPELVVLLQNRGCEVSGIRVKVQVSVAPVPRKTAPRQLSKTARNALDGLSASLDDSPLKQALKKLARD